MLRLPLLIAGAIAILAAQAVVDELAVAREALRDGLWELAREHAAQSNEEAAKIVILESYAAEGRWQDVEQTLAKWPEATGAAFDYYRAVVRGDHATAMKLLETGECEDGLAHVRFHEASTLAANGDAKGAIKLWRQIATMTNVDENVTVLASVNLNDVDMMRRAYERAKTPKLRIFAGLRLGRALCGHVNTAAQGVALVRSLAKEDPDAEGAMDAFIVAADAELSAEHWKEADAAYREAVEIWPKAAQSAIVQHGRGWASLKLGRLEEALDYFKSAEALATEDAAKAASVMKQGDILSELGRGEEALAKYRDVLTKFPQTAVTQQMRETIAVREREDEGKRLYRAFRFTEAQAAFADVAARDPLRKPRMDFYAVLCLYGQGRDTDADKAAEKISVASPDATIRAEATLWRAKLAYNHGAWRSASALFLSYAENPAGTTPCADAFLWAARAQLAENDFANAIKTVTRLSEKDRSSALLPQALAVQGEALVELARFDEAVLVLERVITSEGISASERMRAAILRADALFAMGADNPVRYEAALKAYRAVRLDSALDDNGQIVVAFKIARTLEKLKRIDEAIDQYYTQVVYVYREGRTHNVRYNEEARAAFSRAAFWLADEYESRGRIRQSIAILELIAQSDVPAAAEAAKRLDRISSKGRFL